MMMKMKISKYLELKGVDHVIDSCAVSDYKAHLSSIDIIISSQHLSQEMQVGEGQYILGVQNMLSPKSFGDELMALIQKCTLAEDHKSKTMSFKQSLIDNRSIRLNVEVDNWRDAIKLGTDLLEQSGAIEPSYYDTIIKGVEEHGPYICIAQGLALPHARPEDGVNRTAFALITLAKAIEIDGESVQVLVTLAGNDSHQHMEGLRQITEVLDDEASASGVNLDGIIACETEEDVYLLIDQVLREKER